MTNRWEYHERNARPQLTESWLDRAVSFVAPVAGLRRMRARAVKAMAAYEFKGAEQSRLRADWILSSSIPTPPSAERSTLRERARDLNRNDPVASGATETLAINVAGQGLQLQSRIRADVLRVSEERARELQRQAELIWATWKPFADSANRLDFDEMQFLALRKVVEDGEVLALPIMAPEPWRPLKRAVELIEADRLVNTKRQAGMSFSLTDDGAIETGTRGEPTKYWIQKADGTESVGVAARDDKGRPRVIHIFRTNRPGQLRGVPLFAPVMTLFKDLADTVEAEVVAARVAACLAVFVTMTDPAYAAYATHTDTETDTGHRLQGLEPGLISYLKPGESIGVVSPTRPGDTFEPFVEMVLRMIAMSLNLPYELLTKDFSKTNYSSARAAILEGRRMFMTWRGWFAKKFCQPVYDLVLEEAFLRGQFEAPDFYEMRSEYTRAAWLGGGWGWVDPVKEVEASRKAIDYGLSTLADEAAGQGRDWEETLEQQKREEDKAKELGVLIRHAGGGTGQGRQQEEIRQDKQEREEE